MQRGFRDYAACTHSRLAALRMIWERTACRLEGRDEGETNGWGVAPAPVTPTSNRRNRRWGFLDARMDSLRSRLLNVSAVLPTLRTLNLLATAQQPSSSSLSIVVPAPIRDAVLKKPSIFFLTHTALARVRNSLK